MTITTQDLIDAAKAIGINVYPDYEYPDNNLLFVNQLFGGFDHWYPQHDKSQLMDLYYILNIGVNFFPEGGGYLNHKNIQGFMHFANNFESFAEAIILAAAEIGRGKQ